MSAHVLLNLLKSRGKEIKCEVTSLIDSIIQEHKC